MITPAIGTACGIHPPPDPARPRRLMARLRHLFGRTSLTAAEVDLLRGICRDIDRQTKCAQSAATGSAMPSAKDMT